MKEFELSNGQRIELTEDGILIKGNLIEINGNVTIIKDDKHANISEQNGDGVRSSIITIQNELVTQK